MGLVWSATEAEGQLAESTYPPPPAGSLDIRVTAEVNDAVVASRIITRLGRSPAVRRIEVRDDGLAGTLLPSGAGPHPAVIVLGGSEGGLSEGRAALLASHGLAALALAYFRFEHLPPTLTNVPLEYFETAIRWLRLRDDIRPAGVGVLGGSRGGELALLLGATFPEISAVAAYVLSHVCWGSVGGPPDAGAWTYQGQPVPRMIWPERGGVIAALQDREAEVRAAIPVPTCRSAWRTPSIPSRCSSMPRGGTAQGSGFASADSWPQTLRFLAERLQ